MKHISEISSFERHTERKQYTPNANTNIKNKILVGSKNITEDAEEYLRDVKLRKNSVLGRDLLLTASPEFFKDIDTEIFERWIDKNVEWLKEEFGENLRYCCLHLDETSPHFSVLIIPKFWNEKKQSYVLSNTRYFDGKSKMTKWQDRYSEAMKDFNLKRGIKHSQAKHIDIKTFYSLVNSELKEQDLNNLTAKAKHGELLNVKIKSLQKTLNIYKDFNKKTDVEKEQIKKENVNLFKKVKDIQKDKDIYKECIKTMSKLFDISKKDISEVLKYVTEKAGVSEREK